MRRNLINDIYTVYNALCDEESKKCFEDRIFFDAVFGVNQRIDECRNAVFDYNETSRIYEIERRYGHNATYSIAGAGKKGLMSLKRLRHGGYDVDCFIDNDKDKQGTWIEGLPVVSYEDYCLNNQRSIVFIANDGYGAMFHQKLREYGLNENRIMHISDKFIVQFGNEYFDFYKHEKGKQEVFIDAGAFDGSNVIAFKRWCNGEYDRIYAFEPNESSYAFAFGRLKEISKCKLYKMGLADKCYKAYFTKEIGHPEAARITEKETDYSIDTTTIDKILDGKEVTFLKMDIEGGELSALAGASHAIKTYKPFMAISLYHNEYDLLDIPLYVLSLVPEYKLFIRHYSNTRTSLVLYCVASM